jgi:glycosyltransferase involved in cell wall biosynthesis
VNVWVLQMGEPISFFDGGNRPFRTEMLVNRLVERGNSVLHWTSTFDQLRKTFRFCEGREVTMGARLRYRFLHGPTPYTKSVSIRHSRHDRELARDFCRCASEEAPPDLILCSIPPLRLARRVSEYARRRSVPLILDVRDRWPDSFLRALHFPLYQLFHWIFRHERRRAQQVLHGADAVSAITEDCLRWAHRQADRPPGPWDRVFPLAYEEPPATLFATDRQRWEFRKSLSLGKTAAIITCIGRVGSVFDFAMVVALARQFAAEGRRDVRFVLAGENPVRHQRLPNLTVTGWLDRLKLQKLLAVSTIGLLPYRDMQGPTVRNKAMDFLAMGVPVVSSLGGELSQLMEQYRFGLSFPAGDLPALRLAVDQILRSTELQAAMRIGAGKAFQEHFTATQVYGAFAEFLEEFHRAHSPTPPPGDFLRTS